MAIEIIEQGDEISNDIDVPTDTGTPEGQEPTVETEEPTATTELPEDPQLDSEIKKPEEPSDKSQEDSDGEKDVDAADTGESEHFFGDTPVSVTIDDDVRAELDAKGINVDEVVAEMYVKDGTGRPSEESMQKLYEAFGKFSVDAYFNALDIQNNAAIESSKAEIAAAEAAQEARWTDVCEMIGGEEVWGELSTFADETLSDEEFQAFNEIMESGMEFAQNLALIDLQQKMAAQKGDASVKLLDGQNSVYSQEGDDAPLSRAEYIKLTGELSTQFPFDKDGYAKAQSKLDARRRAALA